MSDTDQQPPKQEQVGSPAVTGPALNGREVTQILGLVSALAAMTAATPSLIIRSLSGVLWTGAEEKELLAEARIFDPLMRRIINDMVRMPNVEVTHPETKP